MDKLNDNNGTKKKNVNPLYVVTNKGKDIEEVDNHLNAWIKKLGLEPVIEFLETILVMLSEHVNSYPILMAVKEYIDMIVEKVEELMRMADPVFSSFFPESINLFGGLISFDLPKKK